MTPATKSPQATLERLEALDRAEGGLLRRQGSVVASWRHYKGRRLGPYYRLAYRDGRRQVSIYLGRCAELVEKVRCWLHELRSKKLISQQLNRMRTEVKRQLRAHKKVWQQQLERVGLELKGYEVRGWRRFEKRVQQLAASRDPPFPRQGGHHDPRRICEQAAAGVWSRLAMAHGPDSR